MFTMKCQTVGYLLKLISTVKSTQVCRIGYLYKVYHSIISMKCVQLQKATSKKYLVSGNPTVSLQRESVGRVIYRN